MLFINALMPVIGGQGGIRTHGGVTPTPVFKTGAFNRSATCPLQKRANYIRFKNFVKSFC